MLRQFVDIGKKRLIGTAIGDMIYELFKTLANTVCDFSQFETR